MSGVLVGGVAVFVIIGIANMVIGGLIGLCGIAGFLLPMLYTGALGYNVDQALAYSFLAFLVSGCIGAWQYRREGNLDIPLSVKLGAGSAIGAVAGVALQAMIEKEAAKVLLYVVVLFSGISILLRMWKEKKSAEQEEKKSGRAFTENIKFLILLGITTGMVCALSGAGGPILVMPLLVVCGVSARIAVGVALFDSVSHCYYPWNWCMGRKPICWKDTSSGVESIYCYIFSGTFPVYVVCGVRTSRHNFSN